MNIRSATFGLVVVALVLLPGCPLAGSNLAGTWVFAIAGGEVGVILMPNGEATSFMIDGIFAGTLSWHVHGDQFVMDSTVVNSSRTIFSALISSDGTMLDGAGVAWSGSNQGLADTFTATKSP